MLCGESNSIDTIVDYEIQLFISILFVIHFFTQVWILKNSLASSMVGTFLILPHVSLIDLWLLSISEYLKKLVDKEEVFFENTNCCRMPLSLLLVYSPKT